MISGTTADTDCTVYIAPLLRLINSPQSNLIIYILVVSLWVEREGGSYNMGTAKEAFVNGSVSALVINRWIWRVKLIDHIHQIADFEGMRLRIQRGSAKVPRWGKLHSHDYGREEKIKWVTSLK